MEIVSYAENEDEKKIVEALVKRLNLTMVDDETSRKQGKLMLRFNQDGLALIDDKLALCGDFRKMLKRLKLNNLRSELLVKAAKIKNMGNNPTAIDATAGMGEDALLLAAAGFSVKLYEYNPIIAALLQDTLNRAEKVPELTRIVERMHLSGTNSIDALHSLTNPPDLILLDPMFPARQKSGLVKKKFQLLQHLEQPCTDEEELVQAAIKVNPRKIIIKRPSKGPYLAGIKPSYSIEGKGIRYDCLIFQ